MLGTKLKHAISRQQAYKNDAFANVRQMIFGLVCAALALGAQSAWAIAGKIENIIGTARVAKQTGQIYAAIKGDNLYEGDSVATAANSNVQIRMVDEAIVWVRPNTEFKITRYRSTEHGEPKNEAVLRLLKGSMRTVTGLIGRSNTGDYKLSTPTATIGIRGTEFDAVYVTPQIAADLQTPPGTYNRVYMGGTSLQGRAGQINLNKDEAGFMGEQASSPPRVLPNIPEFLNTSGNSTANLRAAAPSAPANETRREPVVAAASKQLLISVRYGEADSSRVVSTSAGGGNNAEQRVQATEGERATVTLRQSTGVRRPGSTAVPVEIATMIELVAKINGETAVVQFSSKNQGSNARGSQTSMVDTTLTVPMDVWTEVSGRGPWTSGNSSSVSSSSRGASADDSKVYLRIQEVRR
jgi:hypothetical protein